MIRLYKYQGAGNDFLLMDNRAAGISVTAGQIASLCDRRYGVGADGLMLLENSESADFRMVYYNSDGSGGMMCGNGGRCIAAFAADLGISPSLSRSARPDDRSVQPESQEDCTHGQAESSVSGFTDGGRTVYCFEAPDGLHQAEIVRADGLVKTVRLKMIDVHGITPYGNPAAAAPVTADFNDPLHGYFLDTGTRHFVKFVSNLRDYDVLWDGRTIRNRQEFAPEGTNVNFVEPLQGILNVRTFEKGVEDETYACGTGIVASAIAAFHHMSSSPDVPYHFRDAVGRYSDGRVHVDVQALKDRLSVDFRPVEDGAEEVWLTGPAARVAEIVPASVG